MSFSGSIFSDFATSIIQLFLVTERWIKLFYVRFLRRLSVFNWLWYVYCNNGLKLAWVFCSIYSKWSKRDKTHQPRYPCAELCCVGWCLTVWGDWCSELNMSNYHKPRTFRSLHGCCICKAKSSSSRFTDSEKYEHDFSGCFKTDDGM